MQDAVPEAHAMTPAEHADQLRRVQDSTRRSDSSAERHGVYAVRRPIVPVVPVKP